MKMQSIFAWFKANRHRVDEILWRNRSYIFFRDVEVYDPALRPIAEEKVPLTLSCSVAVDRLLYTFGTPFFIAAPALTAGDLFAGSGLDAGEIAGVVRSGANFFALLPKPLLAGGLS